MTDSQRTQLADLAVLPHAERCCASVLFNSDLKRDISAFLVDREARGLSPRTVSFYREKLGLLAAYLLEHGIADVPQITPDILRCYLLDLGRTHNAGGVHAIYRAIRAFLRWWEDEDYLPGWRNPLARVRPPKVPTAPLEPAPLESIQAMLRTCEARTFHGDRDRAIGLALLDTGCRASEFVAVNLGDIDLATGQILVRRGKGAKPRAVFLGKKSRKALLAYLRHRDTEDPSAPLWVTRHGSRLTYAGLREVVRRRARRAGVIEPSLHDFRRAFALACLRKGMDVFSLQRLMGHSDLSVLRRYLAQTTEDTRLAHQQSGPVDNLL